MFNFQGTEGSFDIYRLQQLGVLDREVVPRKLASSKKAPADLTQSCSTSALEDSACPLPLHTIPGRAGCEKKVHASHGVAATAESGSTACSIQEPNLGCYIISSTEQSRTKSSTQRLRMVSGFL